MTPEHYRVLLKKIDSSLHRKRRAELKRIEDSLNEERQRLIESVRATWSLDNETDPPDLEIPEVKRGESKESVADEKDSEALVEDLNRTDTIRLIVREFNKDSIVTSFEVINAMERKYPHYAAELIGRKTVIAKVLRRLARSGELEKVRSGKGTQPTVYKKLI